MVVDEEIYRRLPTLLIATVDKFAQMPWNGAVQMLFGQVNGLCSRHGFRSPKSRTAIPTPKPRRGLPSATTQPHRPASTARSDYSRRIASDQRAAGNAGRPLRNGHRQALHLGSEWQEGSAQGRSPRRPRSAMPTCRFTSCSCGRSTSSRPRTGRAGQLLLPPAGAERRSIQAVDTWASVPLVGV